MVISAFPACGKSYFCSIYKDTLDSDSSLFSWIKDDTDQKMRNPEFPNNYIEHIKQNYKNSDIDYIFVSSHAEVRNLMKINKIPYVLVYPNKNLKAEWIGRCYLRGSTTEFIENLSKYWDRWVEECMYDDGAVFKIALNSGEYLSDYLNKGLIKKGIL